VPLPQPPCQHGLPGKPVGRPFRSALPRPGILEQYPQLRPADRFGDHEPAERAGPVPEQPFIKGKGSLPPGLAVHGTAASSASLIPATSRQHPSCPVSQASSADRSAAPRAPHGSDSSTSPASAPALPTSPSPTVRICTGPPWQGLNVHPGDLLAEKTAFSAFFPGRCPLPPLLEERGITTILVAGTVTNVCCESSARDASTLGYRVIMVADANAAMRDQDHNAALHTIYRSFGDVRPIAEVIDMIESAAS
jgi:nicotinamidase-related amidase